MTGSPSVRQHRTLIIGGGFGGLYAARNLGADSRIEVTIVDRRNFHLFQPLLYQVATGALGPSEITQPLRSMLGRRKNTTVLLGEAVALDPDRREVRLADGGTIRYDSLVVATGAGTSYFGHDEWARHAPASNRSTTRWRSGAGSSSPFRPPNGRQIPLAVPNGQSPERVDYLPRREDVDPP